jgi:hypothetical protein
MLGSSSERRMKRIIQMEEESSMSLKRSLVRRIFFAYPVRVDEASVWADFEARP